MEPVFNILFSLQRGKSGNGDWIVSCLAGAWPKLLGDRLAAVCRPVSFKNAELVIELTDSGWDGALKSVKAEMLKKLRSATAGAVQSVSVKKASTV